LKEKSLCDPEGRSASTDASTTGQWCGLPGCFPPGKRPKAGIKQEGPGISNPFLLGSDYFPGNRVNGGFDEVDVVWPDSEETDEEDEADENEEENEHSSDNGSDD
jgi:hypothetical protein